MQTYKEGSQRLPIRPRHLVGALAQEQLALDTGRRSQHKAALQFVTAALNVLTALLTVSEAAQALAAASCRYSFIPPDSPCMSLYATHS